MRRTPPVFDDLFRGLTGFGPLAWQRRLFDEGFGAGQLPDSCDIPTGLGKTSVMALWLIARAAGIKLPRRLVYVVDRRAVVDQATAFAEILRERAGAVLGLKALAISTLRGRFVDNRDWLADPAAPAIVTGTIDMVGSRLLFEGYGVSRRMRPVHAGLLGADTLVVLDEAHLVPPFERLLVALRDGAGAFGPRRPQDRALLPPFRLLSLSATGRDDRGAVFCLEEGDLDAETSRRLGAVKTATFREASGGSLHTVLAEEAWELSRQGTLPVRCLVYCDSRETAQATAEWLRARTDAVTLFVGARRVREREDAARALKAQGFLAGSGVPPEKPVFLIATAAGEVGVDLDADHMVCDLVAWERMVQRLGRVNRLGRGKARIRVIDPGERADAAPSRILGRRSRAVLEMLPRGDEGFDVSPGALRALKARAGAEPAVAAAIKAATTPAPLYPALSRAVVEAWSMTSLDRHTGRPEIAPWLRGWEPDEPRTSVVWRRHLPIRLRGAVPQGEVEEFFEAAPPHASEMLETETARVSAWLAKRAKAVEKAGMMDALDVVAHVLSPAGDLRRTLRLQDCTTGLGKDLAKVGLAGAVVVVDARLAGLGESGLLDPQRSAPPRTLDDGSEWLEPVAGRPAILFRVREAAAGTPPTREPGWREGQRFDLDRSEDGDSLRWLAVETWRDGATTEPARAAGPPQELSQHQQWVAERALEMARALDLPELHTRMLTVAARSHDLGKQAPHWQRAFNAPRDGKVYAKTEGPIDHARLGGYRHEFGSLPLMEGDPEFRALPPDLQDLALHLVAAHHGGARPLIGTSACQDAPPSALLDRARAVALRFARLQKRWGPWGLAWWESLLRAADQRASRDNDAQRASRDNDAGNPDPKEIP